MYDGCRGLGRIKGLGGAAGLSGTHRPTGARELQKSTRHATVWAPGPFQPVPVGEGGAAPGELCTAGVRKSKGRAGVLSFLLHTEQLSGAEEQKWDASSGLRGDTRQATAS